MTVKDGGGCPEWQHRGVAAAGGKGGKPESGGWEEEVDRGKRGTVRGGEHAEREGTTLRTLRSLSILWL